MRGTSDGVTERKEQDMAKDQDKKGIPKVQIDMFNWGPCVVRLRINEDFQNKLLDEAKKNEEDYVGKLAGQIKKETGYSDKSREILLPMCLVLLDYITRPTKRIRRRSLKRLLSISYRRFG